MQAPDGTRSPRRGHRTLVATAYLTALTAQPPGSAQGPVPGPVGAAGTTVTATPAASRRRASLRLASPLVRSAALRP